MDVDHYLQQVFELIRQVTQEETSIDALCPAVCCPALVPLDAKFRPLHPALSHLHQASRPQSVELVRQIGKECWLKTAGNLPVPGGISISSLRWLSARHPRVVADARYWVHLHSVLLHSFTGRLLTDPTQAAYTGLYDVPGGTGWLDDGWLGQFGVKSEQLPEIVPSASVAGKLTAEASQNSGLQEGLPVVTGGADIPNGLLAAEGVIPEAALNISGTTPIVAASCDYCPDPSENYMLRPYLLPGRWAVAKVSPVGGETLNWFHKRFCREMTPDRFWDWIGSLDVEVEQVIEDQDVSESIEETLEFIPYLHGYRHSIEPQKAAFTGISSETTREDMLCAVLVAYRRYLHEAAMEIAAAINRPLHHVVTSGGYDISALGFHRRAALSRSTLIPIEAAVLRGAAILANMAL
jgi:xylulokinase